jgi:lipopolysaccharide transport system ATP-binding protein
MDQLNDKIEVFFPKNNFNYGVYYVTIYITVDGICADWIDNAFSFDMEKGDYFKNGKIVPTVQSKILFDFDLNFK